MLDSVGDAGPAVSTHLSLSLPFRDVSKVQNLFLTFQGASSFNSDISAW